MLKPTPPFWGALTGASKSRLDQEESEGTTGSDLMVMMPTPTLPLPALARVAQGASLGCWLMTALDCLLPDGFRWRESAAAES